MSRPFQFFPHLFSPEFHEGLTPSAFVLLALVIAKPKVAVCRRSRK
jgi:hypothetical protein